MIAERLTAIATIRMAAWMLAAGALIAALGIAPARAQAPLAPRSTDPGVVVIGEGSVNVTPDLAQITNGVSTRAKTVREAADANSKAMSAVMAALAEAGVAPKDIQTSRFSVQPIYAAPEPRAEQKLIGYAVSNQISVKIRQLDKLGQIIDRVVAAGATDVGNVEFLVSDQAKALDRAREAAIADARRKGEIYAHASGLALGRVVWVSEDTDTATPVARRFSAHAAVAAAVPVSVGEDTLRARVVVGFELSR
jgi:uncharacterized protein